jgi:replicative DNA helicase
MDNNMIPPHSIEVEQSIIGSILIEASLCEDLDITPDHFYRLAHKTLLETILTLRNSGDAVDMITVSEALKKEGKLDLVGGNTYIASISSAIVSAKNAKNHVKVLKDLSAKRDILQACREVIANIEGDEVDELLGRLNINVDVGKKESIIGIKSVIDNVLKDMERRYESDDVLSGVPTGFQKVDEVTDGLQGGDLIIVAGRPSMGKSALAVQIGRNASMGEAKVPTHVQSIEMSNSQLGLRIISESSGISGSRIRKAMLRKDELTQLYTECGVLREIPMTFDDVSYRLIDIRRGIHRAYKRGARFVILDYIQLVANDGAKNRERQVGEITTMLKQTAKELNIPIMALAQLSRDVEKRENKRPVMSDLRDSGQLEQDADIIIFLYRDGYYKKSMMDDTAELIVAKGRNIGTGTIHVGWDGQTTRFIDLEG